MSEITIHDCTINIKQNIHEGGQGIIYENGSSEQIVTIPKELTTDDAKAMLVKLQKAGYLDEHYQKTEHVSWAVASIIAFELCQALNMPGNWKPFEMLWNHTGLRNNYDGVLNTNSQAIDISNQIKLLLKQ